MIFCPICGIQSNSASPFCGACGSPLGGASAQQAPSLPVASAPLVAPPGPDPGYLYPAPALAQVAQQPRPVFFTGDWRGAAILTAIGVGTMLGMSLLVTLIAGSASSGSLKASRLIGGIFQMTGMAAGGSYGTDSSSLYFRPLGITAVGYTLIAVYFMRRLRQAGPLTLLGLGLQAGRVAVVHLGVMLVVSLLSRVAGEDGHLEVFSTAFYGTFTLGTALLIAWIVAPAGTAPPRVEYYRHLIAGPVKAVLLLVAASCAVTFLLVVVLSVSESAKDTGQFSAVLGQSGLGGGGFADEWRGLIGLLIAFLPTAAGWALLAGMGVPMSASGAKGSSSILDLIDQEPVFLLWPLATVALLVFAGWYSARHSPAAPSGRPVGWWLTAVLPVALFVLALTASIRTDLGERTGSVGFDLLFVLFLGALYGLGAGMLGTVLVPRQAPMTSL